METITTIRTQKDLARFNDAVLDAINAAGEFANVDDGGTCNFDSVAIKISIPARMAECARVRMDKMLARDYSSIWRGYYMLDLPLRGQADRRTMMAEVAAKSLQLGGYDACVYYAMD